MTDWEPRVLRVTLTNRHGMHARPAHLFVQTANSYAADVKVGRSDNDERVDGKSIMGMMMLAAECGSELEISASGPDAEALLRSLEELVECPLPARCVDLRRVRQHAVEVEQHRIESIMRNGRIRLTHFTLAPPVPTACATTTGPYGSIRLARLMPTT